MLSLVACTGWDETETEAVQAPEGGPPDVETPEAVALEPLRVGLAIPSYVHAVGWIADDKGFFEAEGLDAEVAVMGGSAATMRALIAEATDLGLAGGDALIKADAAGADLVIVAGFVNRFYHRLVARKETLNTRELRGRKIGLPFLGGPQDMAVRYALTQAELEYGKDVEILSLGKEFNLLAALSRGEIDATTSQTPPSRLEELGLTVLADLPNAPVAFPYLTAAVRRADLEAHPERVAGALRALCEGVEFYQGSEVESLGIVQAHLQDADTAEAAAERYRMGGPALMSWPPVPDEAGLQSVIDALGEQAGGLAVKDVVDLSVLDEVRRGGGCGGL